MSTERFNHDPSTQPSTPNYAARRLGVAAAGLTAALAAGAGIVTLNHTSDVHAPVSITIDRVDDQGNQLDDYTAAVEDITHATFKQLDELALQPEQRQQVADSIADATETAMTGKYGDSLIGKTVGVKIVNDIWGNPKVAVVRQK